MNIIIAPNYRIGRDFAQTELQIPKSQYRLICSEHDVVKLKGVADEPPGSLKVYVAIKNRYTMSENEKRFLQEADIILKVRNIPYTLRIIR